VLITTLYNPLRLAAEICMLDHLTKGRIEIGTGRGVSPYELAFYNVDPREAPAIYKESVEVLMAALTQDTVDYHGKHFDYKNVPIEMKPLQQPHPPLWYGTGSPETAAMAARQNANIVSLQTASEARVPIGRYKEVWEATHGRSGKPMPKAGLTRFLYVGESDRQAEERGKFGFDKFYESLAYLWRKFGAVPMGLDEPSRMRKETLIAGTPSTVREIMERQLEECGANYFVARFAYGNLTHEESVRSLELFKAEVMPYFQK
jgi:alkanesulfonate monooxygenase SsuD/methylene tetrahydromethanopterin reductase-like flavin-dependent oxidoreductase (luciferase family)